MRSSARRLLLGCAAAASLLSAAPATAAGGDTSYTGVAKGWPVPGGRFSRYSGEMHARFNHARTVVTGTWQVHDTERDATGNAVDQCDSGAVRFTAQR